MPDLNRFVEDEKGEKLTLPVAKAKSEVWSIDSKGRLWSY